LANESNNLFTLRIADTVFTKFSPTQYGDWVGPRASLDVSDKRKLFVLPGNLNPESQINQTYLNDSSRPISANCKMTQYTKVLNNLTRNVIFKPPVQASSDVASKSISHWNERGMSIENGLQIQTLSDVCLFSLVPTTHQNMLHSVTEIQMRLHPT
jgi:hypothetical protein